MLIGVFIFRVTSKFYLTQELFNFFL